MGFLRIILSVSLLVCCVRQVVVATQTGTQLDIDERVFAASKVYALLQFHSSQESAGPDFDLDRSYRIFLRKIVATEDRKQFDLATIEFVAELHNGHTFFWDTWLDKNNQALGFFAIPLDGKWVVQSSFLDQLKPGDVISGIDGTAIEVFFLQQQRYISGSSTAAQRRNLFLRPYLFPEQFVLVLEGGRRVEVNRGTLSKPRERTEGRWVKPDKVAYIRIPAFFDPSQEEEALDYVRQFHRAGTLIIDVRNNAGGIPPERLIRALMDRPYRQWLESTRVNATCSNADQEAVKNRRSTAGPSREVTGMFTNSLGNSLLTTGGGVVSPSRNAFRGRLILLVDGGCISACEDFVEPSKDSGRATLVGETTQGSSGLPFIYDFHNGMSLRIAIKRNYFPDGSEFEGVGIKPNIEVHTTIEDLKNGRDPVLERASELAAKP